jgi:hypothetical protein
MITYAHVLLLLLLYTYNMCFVYTDGEYDNIRYSTILARYAQHIYRGRAHVVSIGRVRFRDFFYFSFKTPPLLHYIIVSACACRHGQKYNILRESYFFPQKTIRPQRVHV